MIPQGATYELQDKRFVYVVTKDNYAVSRAVVTTANDNGQFFIVKSGLKPGEQVIVDGASTLRDSTLITPRIVNADSLYQKSE